MLQHNEPYLAGPLTTTVVGIAHCHNKIETLAHVLESCQIVDTLRNIQHHKKIRSLIPMNTDAMYSLLIPCIARNIKNNKLEVSVVYGLADNGITRGIDIICIKKPSIIGPILQTIFTTKIIFK